MRTKIPFLFTLALLFFFTSCGSRKKLVYFQDTDEDSMEIQSPQLSTIFEVGDILSVEVSGPDNELTKPFNLPDIARQGNQIGGYDNGVPSTAGYLIFSDSTISLPIIGRVKAAGLTREELIQKVQELLTEYLESPQVAIQIQNFKITILGEVDNPGTYKVPNERITILEAIGLAKDLKITGKRKNVLVIRYINGIKKEYRVDLTKRDVFASDVYFLKQNDIIYVEPNWKSRFESSPMKSTTGLFVSITSIIISSVALITK